MTVGGTGVNHLSDQAVERIEATALRLLDEIGVALEHPGAVEMLEGRGCRVEGGRIHVPGDVVRWALDNVTPHTTFHRADGSTGFKIDGSVPRFHNGGGCPFFLDAETGERRPARVDDLSAATRLLDALPNLDLVTPLTGIQDVPDELLVVASTAEMLRHAHKPLMSGAVERPRDIPFLVEMAAARCGSMEAFRQRPNLVIAISPISPLRGTADGTAAIMAAAEHGAPFFSLPAPTLGGSAPITMAGALALQHAEVLFTFVIAAAARPGARVVYCSRLHALDMRDGRAAMGGPETGLAAACAARLAHRAGLPIDGYGFMASTDLLDPQFGYERMANALTATQAGVDLISGLGMTDTGMVGGLELAVIDDEMAGMVRRIVAGCPVDDATLAFDLMAEVIPRDGLFLAEMHTVEHMRRGATWMPTISARKDPSGASQEGVVVAARARAKELLEKQDTEPPPDDVLREIDEIVERAQRELGKG